MYSTPDDELRVVCTVSRMYEGSKNNYWFAFHPHQRDALVESKVGYAAFGCGSPALTLLIPIKTLLPWLEGINTTIKENRQYWHIQIFQEEEQLVLMRKKGQSKIGLDEFKV